MKTKEELLELLDDNSFTDRMLKKELNKLEGEKLEKAIKLLNSERTICTLHYEDDYDIKELFEEALNADFELNEECE